MRLVMQPKYHTSIKMDEQDSVSRITLSSALTTRMTFAKFLYRERIALLNLDLHFMLLSTSTRYAF